MCGNSQYHWTPRAERGNQVTGGPAVENSIRVRSLKKSTNVGAVGGDLYRPARIGGRWRTYEVARPARPSRSKPMPTVRGNQLFFFSPRCLPATTSTVKRSNYPSRSVLDRLLGGLGKPWIGPSPVNTSTCKDPLSPANHRLAPAKTYHICHLSFFDVLD